MGSTSFLASTASRQRPSVIAKARSSFPLRSTIVVETCEDCANGNGPSATTQAASAQIDIKPAAAARIAAVLIDRRRGDLVAAGAIAATSLIWPDGPPPIRCRYDHNARDCTCPRHRLEAAQICLALPRAPHR